MGTKMAVAFANIFMAKIEKEILRQSSIKPIFWKRFISMTSYQYGTQAETKQKNSFYRQTTSILQSNSITAEISETETTFLDTKGTKVSDSTRILSLTCEHTSSLQKHSNTFVFVSPTRRHKKASSKGFQEQIPLQSLLKRT